MKFLNIIEEILLKNLVRYRGIEPRSEHWQCPIIADIRIPHLNLQRSKLVAERGIEPLASAYETDELPLLYSAVKFGTDRGIRTPTLSQYGLSIPCLPSSTIPALNTI